MVLVGVKASRLKFIDPVEKRGDGQLGRLIVLGEVGQEGAGGEAGLPLLHQLEVAGERQARRVGQLQLGRGLAHSQDGLRQLSPASQHVAAFGQLLLPAWGQEGKYVWVANTENRKFDLETEFRLNPSRKKQCNNDR